MLVPSAWGQAVGALPAVIVYSLRCKNGHEFEGWFRDSASYDRQAEDGKLIVPDLQFAPGGKSDHGARRGGQRTQAGTLQAPTPARCASS